MIATNPIFATSNLFEKGAPPASKEVPIYGLIYFWDLISKIIKARSTILGNLIPMEPLDANNTLALQEPLRTAVWMN